MRRLRFYKILLPVILVVFLVLLVRALDPPEQSHSDFAPDIAPSNLVEGVAYSEFEGSKVFVDLEANRVEEEDGRVKLDKIHNLRFHREGASPLLVQAGQGDITGGKGQRVLRFDEEVSFEDPDKQMKVHILSLEVDQEAQEARTTDPVRLEGGKLSGSAQGIVYGLNGQPGRVDALELEDASGASLSARRAVLHDGLRDVELFDTVRIERGAEKVGSEQMRIYRRQDDSIERIEALKSVTAELPLSALETVRLDSDTLNIDFDENADIASMEASSAIVDAGAHLLEARTLRGRRVGAPEHEWRLVADGEVSLKSVLNGEAARLQADTSVALLDQGFALVEATASGEVRFDSGGTHAEADWAALFATRDEVRLVGSAKKKARLAHLATRVAAERITTDSRGVSLIAEEQVEATLLPRADESARRAGVFATGSAVHFLAERLEGENSGERLTFSGGVRGWQGNRTLSADTMTLDQSAETMVAEDNVTARIPRGKDVSGTSEADYIQIAATRLDYSEATRIAEFSESVRVQITEGWVEGRSIEVTLSEASSEIELILAEGDVRLEFHDDSRDSGDGSPQLMEGKADRLKFDPLTGTVWLFGDNAPATVRRVGAEQGTTSGRVLRYELDGGSLEVDSSAGGAARIRTSGN